MLFCLAACGQSWGNRGETWAEDPPKEVLALAGRDLGPAEQATLDKTGLVVLAADPVQSFHVGYTALFHAHMPVYVTADSLLYAWHASYDKILISLELGALKPALDAMLDGLRQRLATAEADPKVRADLDVYLTVASSLERGELQPPVAGGDLALIKTLFEHATAAEGLDFELFGAPAEFDFSMLKPRGHYTELPDLQHYFRAMSWLGRAEVRIAHRDSPESPWTVNRRALGASLLVGALFDTALKKQWHTIDATVNAFVGPSDSLSLPGLDTALGSLTGAIADKSDAEIVAAFAGPAAQKIHTQLARVGEDSIAFLLLGQRYVFDASVLGGLVAGSIDSDRLMPSPLDVAHAVFHNPAAKALLAKDLARYGAPYADALAAKAAEPLPDNSLAHLWLGALRELSPDAKRDAALPAPFTTEPFARRMLGTQLASWAELRHDNLLYTKQSFTAELGCEYPAAYVDPYPAFYAKMKTIAERARATIATLSFPAKNGQAIDHYFETMAATMTRLQAIAERERANQPMTDDDLQFIDHMVSLDGRSIVCSTTIDPKGWYAELFFEQKEALWHTPVIADVHTQPTDGAGNMVGRVLHVATGLPHFMAITIQHDHGGHAQTYRGLVSSYAEIVTEKFQRLTDEEWRDKIKNHMVGVPAWMSEISAGR